MDRHDTTNHYYLDLWKETFTDPSTSPARYTDTLFVGCTHVVTPGDAEAGGWIRGFSRVVNLGLKVPRPEGGESGGFLASFYGLSPIIKSLRVYFTALPLSRVFDLLTSFPLLEDLTLTGNVYDTSTDSGDNPDGLPNIVRPLNLPAFTGSLDPPRALGGGGPIARQLLSLPGGIHFRKLALGSYHREELLLMVALVGECSNTLESLDITHSPLGGHIHPTPVPSLMTCSVSSRVEVTLDRPLEGDSTQRRDLPGQITRRRMDYYCAPNHHAQTS